MKRLFFSIMVVSLLLTVGCQRHPAGLPKCYPCSVVLLKDGAVIPDTKVTLVPVEKGKNFVGAGTVDSTGLAVVTTHYRGDEVKGVPAGDYKLVVSAPPAMEMEIIDRSVLRQMTNEERYALQQKTKEAIRDSNPVPVALRTPENSPVTVTVSSGGENKIEVDMSDYEDQ